MNIEEKASIFRDRFFGRQDVYANIYYNREGKKSASPACAKYLKEDCPLKDPSSGITCTTCTVKSHIEVSEESVIKHIEGEEEHAYYVLQQNGTIHFAAFDFDCKDLAKSDDYNTYSFKDVQRATAVLKEWGIPYVTARSTTHGYHVYMFFEEPWSAGKFRGLMEVLLDKAGFLYEFDTYGRTRFEIFPKQISIHGSGLGNPIKPPMIESRFTHVKNQEDGRNCLIDDNNIMIPIQYQWITLRDCPKIKIADIEAIFAKENAIEWTVAGSKASDGGSSTSKTLGNRHVNTERRHSAVHGSIEKVIEGCSAFRELVRKIREENYDPKHDEGFALYHMCLNILDGEKWFELNVPTWGKTQKDRKQLLQSIQKGYTPWSCKKMQEKGICGPTGKKCFDKKPPVEIVEGRPVPLPIPESQWPEPSPVRYALGKGEDFLLKLITESTEASQDSNIETRHAKIAQIIQRSAVFDEDQRKILQLHIESLKIKKKSELNKAFNRAIEERVNVEHEAAREFSGSFVVGETEFIMGPHGYSVVRPGKRGQPSIHIPISNFFIDILEERSVLSEDSLLNTKNFYGKLTSFSSENNPKIYDFEISTDDWFDTASFVKFFGKRCGTDFNPRKMDIDLIRQVATHTAQTGRPPHAAQVKKVAHYTTIGWHNKSFYMPSVVVDSSGIRANEERPVRLPEGSFISSYDFKILSEAEISQTLHNILNDLLPVLDDKGRNAVMCGLSFTLMCGLHKYVKMNGRPALWYNGLTGAGKTEITKILQKFWGHEFSTGFNWDTTYLSILDYAHEARDCAFLMDDYKDSERERRACLPVLQHGYDGNFRGSLNKDGTQKKVKPARSLFLMSGEEVPDQHASVVSRMIVVEVDKIDTAKTKKNYDSVFLHSHNYCGITPLFIHHAITSTSQEDLIARRIKIENELVDGFSNLQNIRRISTNLSFVKLGWSLFLELCRDRGALTQSNVNKLEEEFQFHIEHLRLRMLQRCEESQSINLFLIRLKELITSGSVAIDGHPQLCPTGKEVVGFVREKDGDSVLYLYPHQSLSVVKKHSQFSQITLSTATAGEQLKDSKCLARLNTDKGAQVVVRNNKNIPSKVWAIDAQKIGLISKPTLVPHYQDSFDDFRDSEGVF